MEPAQIDQIILNLSTNARDAMPKGGKLTIETANVNLDEDYCHDHGLEESEAGSYVMLAVSDTGTGMDEESQARIFEPFFTTKEMRRGTGLGLSTVYGDDEAIRKTAENGREALKIADSLDALTHLILTDVVMPGMSGPDLVGELKSRVPDIKALYMSRYTNNFKVYHGVCGKTMLISSKNLSLRKAWEEKSGRY